MHLAAPRRLSFALPKAKLLMWIRKDAAVVRGPGCQKEHRYE
jgi:hypothetical protein